MLMTGEIVVVLVGVRVSDESDACLCLLSGRHSVNADGQGVLVVPLPKENYCQGV